jgi:transcriptional regulator with XRE-family HTH domain
MSELLRFRKKFSLTQVQAAQIFACSPMTWSIWEKGEREPSDYIRGWLKILNEAPIDGVIAEKTSGKLIALGGSRCLQWLAVEASRVKIVEKKPRSVESALPLIPKP